MRGAGAWSMLAAPRSPGPRSRRRAPRRPGARGAVLVLALALAFAIRGCVDVVGAHQPVNAAIHPLARQGVAAAKGLHC